MANTTTAPTAPAETSTVDQATEHALADIRAAIQAKPQRAAAVLRAMRDEAAQAPANPPKTTAADDTRRDLLARLENATLAELRIVRAVLRAYVRACAREGAREGQPPAPPAGEARALSDLPTGQDRRDRQTDRRARQAKNRPGKPSDRPARG